jgi:sarcosine oxidase gamma subunit
MSAAVLEFAPVQFEDGSGRSRCGCKGPGAEVWLRSLGLSVPAASNSVLLDADGVLVARLASSEFLIESTEQATPAGQQRLAAAHAQLVVRAQPRDVYPVARQDSVMTISGTGLNALLRQVCGVDFAPLLDAAADTGEQPVLLTSMIGVGVVAWPRRIAAGVAVTLWCEPSYAHYFWNTLLEVAGQAGSVSMGVSDDTATGQEVV